MSSLTLNSRLKVGFSSSPLWIWVTSCMVLGELEFRVKIWFKMLNWSLNHACMYTLLNFEIVFLESSHTCPYLGYSPWIHHVLEWIDSFNHALEALKLINFMHGACSSCAWSFVWKWVQLNYLWAFILQIDLWNMSYYEF